MDPRNQFEPLLWAVLSLQELDDELEPGSRAADEWDALTAHVRKLFDRYAKELGENAYAVFNAVTDFASHPPANRLVGREPGIECCRASSSAASTPIPRISRLCITSMYTPTTHTRSSGMSSNVKRPGWEICGQTRRGTSDPLKGPYRPRSQQTDERFLEFFTTPHQAGAPPVHDNLENRANYASHGRPRGAFFCVPNPSSRRGSLTRVAESR